MKVLIVNADDFGLTEQVNRGILDAHRHGIVTSTSLMANGPAFDPAVALARTAPGLAVGIHLNLTEGRPLSPAARIPSLIDATQRFAAGPGRLVRRVATGAARLDHIEREWRAQIERVLAAGIAPSHLDGHQHVHAWPPLFAIAMKLALEYAIRGVRSPSERPAAVMTLLRHRPRAAARILKQYGVGRALAVLARGQRRRLRRAGLGCPDEFFGLTQTGFLDAASLEAILRAVPDGSSELMCHPGYFDPALGATPTRLQRQREAELAALTDPGINALIAGLAIRLGTYRDLPAS